MPWKTPDRVKQTSSTTGTGDFTLSGSITGSVAFSAACTTGDTFPYVIQLVDGAGSPGTEWEVGQGTYSGANTLTRTTVLASSNAGALVNFSAGTKQVWIGMNGTMASWLRERLTANRTYYVRTDGSDSNTGLANTSGGAFLTIQKAIDVFAYNIDCAGFAPTVQAGDGTYTGTIAMRPMVGATTLTIQGNSGTPSNVLISTTSATAITNQVPGTTLHVKDLKITTATAGNCMSTVGGIITFANIDFGAAANYHRYPTAGGRITATGNYTISGGAQAHLSANSGGINQTVSRTVTLTGTPNFSIAYAWMGTPAYIEDYSNTFSGSATGKRYSNSALSLINTNGGGANYLPGNVAGDTPTTGAQYI